ncbi:hypothetical protein DRJ72_13930, partial [Enterococcus faecalis]
MKIKNYVKLSVGAVLLSSFLFPCSLIYAESGISSDETTPSAQMNSNLSEKEQKETISSEKDEPQQQEEQTYGTVHPVNHNQHYLYDFFEVAWEGWWWDGYYLITGVKKTDNGVIDIPSQVYYNDNKSEVYQVRVSQKLWDDLKNKNQTFKDSVTKFNFPASGGHKAASFEDKQLNLSSIFGNDKGYIDNNYFGYRNLTSVDLSGLDWKFVNNTRSMFQSCSNLTTVTLGDGTNFLN